MTGPSDWPLPPEGVRFFVPTFLRDHLAGNPLTRELYPHAMGYYPRAAGHAVRRDSHVDHLVLYCCDGAGTLSVDGHEWPVAAGDVMLLPRDVLHAYAASGDDPWTLYWVHFDGTRTGDFWAAIGFERERPVARLGRSPKLLADFETLLGVRRSGYSPPVFVHAANHLRAMLSYLAVVSPRSATRQAGGFDLDHVDALMQANLHHHLDLDTLAASVNLSRYTFARQYKRLTGMPPIQNFIHMKMERACYLLDISTRSVQQIAFELGYEDAYYFSRLFRKVVGVSPTRYRAMRYG
ncbi:AraC family transcriptional regulator [Arhodomonas aquaeolei]|uniref:AraC family transcriptional regulator n=1 Tax=Arhodomonas aquaeolei TaxID=2369 RepID=UPI002167F8DB|nr:AraC family transcriptional regulator [Arhodomonas aquaeolei]MCS4504396.1 AraC family transcriptional regulator [Arhodomonas aquaeolei]